MITGPTTGASESLSAWASRPVLAKLVRLLLFVSPIIIGWLAVRIIAPIFYRPEGWIGTGFWIVQAIVVASVAAHSTKTVANRLAPMSALLNMTMVFPDHAPSRFGVTLRAGNIKKLTPEQLTLSNDTQEAAEQAMALVAALGAHEPRTRGHTERVRTYAELIGQEMGLTDDELNRLRWGMLLHDVGKLTVPAHILNSKEAPTEEQWRILKQHPVEGQKILEPLHGWLGEWGFVALHHHERWDGGGYPAQLEATEISLGGRIAAVADTYDVITSKRSYKEPMSPSAAREELYRCAGTQFDPAVVKAFLRIGLEDGRSAGFLGWLLELPTLMRVTSSVATASPTVGSAMATVAMAVSVSAASLAAAGSVEAPQALAFDDSGPAAEEVVVEETGLAPVVPQPAAAVPNTDPSPTTTAAGPVPTTTAAGPVPTTTAASSAVTTSGPSSTTTAASSAVTTSGPSSTTTAATTAGPSPTTTTTAGPSPTTTTTAGPSPTTTTSAPPRGGPDANDDAITITNAGVNQIDVLDNDAPGEHPIDEATLEIIVAPRYATDYAVRSNHIQYRRDVQDVVDIIVYQICDTNGRCERATVTVTVPN